MPNAKEHSPWASGPGEILRHGLELLKKDSDRNRRLAMISVDNAVELMMKTFLGLPKRINKLAITRKEIEECSESFPRLLDALETHASERLEGIDLGEIEWYHRLRNQLYHQGNGLTVEREKVDVYAALGQILFKNLFGFDLVESAESSAIVTQTKAGLLGEFLVLWVELEKTLAQKATGISPEGDRPRMPMELARQLAQSGELTNEEHGEFEMLRRLRNDLAHGRTDHPEAEISDAAAKLQSILSKVKMRWQ